VWLVGDAGSRAARAGRAGLGGRATCGSPTSPASAAGRAQCSLRIKKSEHPDAVVVGGVYPNRSGQSMLAQVDAANGLKQLIVRHLFVCITRSSGSLVTGHWRMPATAEAL
jgi:hypothetical protein